MNNTAALEQIIRNQEELIGLIKPISIFTWSTITTTVIGFVAAILILCCLLISGCVYFVIKLNIFSKRKNYDSC